jgi:PAS domain S-box-containing protein
VAPLHPWSYWAERFRRRARKPAFMLGLLIVIVLTIGWGLTLWQIDAGRKDAFAAENMKNSNLAQSQEERVLRSLQVLDQALRVLRHDHLSYTDHHSLQDHLEVMRVDTRYIGVVSILGAKGEIVATNTPAMQGNFSDREYFKYHANNPADELHVGKPILGKFTGKWIVSLTRRISHADGSFAGVIFMAVDPSYFITFYEPKALGKHASVALIGLDGITRVRNNNGVTSHGEDASASRLFQELPKADVGQYVGVAASDGQTRTVSYRKIPGYPLVAVVASSLTDVTQSQNRREHMYLALAMVCTLLVTSIGLIVNSAWARIEDALERVRTSERRLQSIFDVTPVPLAINNNLMEIIHVNAAFVSTFGYTRADIPTLEHWWPQAYPDATYREWVISTWGAELARCESTGMAFKPFEVLVRCKDGSDKHVMASASALADSTMGESLVLLYDITSHKAVQSALNDLVSEKNALLKEVHHRVKNNLQVITSLLRLESNRSDSSAVKSALDDMKWRIRTMALVHESLYRTGSYAAIRLDNYLQQLATEVFRSLLDRGVKVELQLDLQPVTVSMNMATPCGLIVNELISNALKHGFKDGRAGAVRITLHSMADTPKIRLCVSDNGVGLPVDFESRKEASLGMQLVSDLALQIGATTTIGPGHLAAFSLEFHSDIAEA